MKQNTKGGFNMVYKEFQDKKLSALGFGAMRLPVSDSIRVPPSMKRKRKRWWIFALRHGVNYFDTAYGYHDGTSEVVMGKVLGKYPRDSYYLATKFPGYDLSNMDKVDTIFEEQLGKCGMEYFDFYLLHNIYEKNIDPYLDPKYGIMDYLLKQRRTDASGISDFPLMGGMIR